MKLRKKIKKSSYVVETCEKRLQNTPFLCRNDNKFYIKFFCYLELYHRLEHQRLVYV